MLHSVFINFIWILLCSAKSAKNRDPEAPIIQTKYGAIQGYTQSNSFMYLGIPFAKPPIGQLRWKPTVDPVPWSPSIYDATFFRPACPQSGCSSAVCPPSVFIRCFLLIIQLVFFHPVVQ